MRDTETPEGNPVAAARSEGVTVSTSSQENPGKLSFSARSIARLTAVRDTGFTR
jgi:hypothetical protein